MNHEVVVAWLAALFGVMAATVAVAALLVSWPVLLVALPLGGTALLLWYHASGRLHRRVACSARRQRVHGPHDAARARRTGVGSAAAGGVGARDRRGTRRTAHAAGFAGAAGAGRSRAARARGRRGPTAPADEMSRQRALSVLDLDPGADGDEVRDAYRRKVKEVHPDRGGDAETFVEVTDAYERLGGDR